MTDEDRIESIASAYETVEGARWRTYEAVHEFVTEVTTKQARADRINMLSTRLGRSKSAVNLWVRAAETVPEDLRYAKLPVATCLWAAQNLSPDEAREWLAKADDNGWSLSRLKAELGLKDTSTLTTTSVRKIMRAIAASLPKKADAPLDDANAAWVEAAVRKAVEKYTEGA